MKRTFLIILSFIMVLLLSGCCLSHDWEEASCAAPKTCSKCGKTNGDTLAHQWKEVTCTEAKTCAVCNATEGSPLGHDWEEATRETPKTCLRCDATEGKPIHPCEACAGTGQLACMGCKKGLADCETCQGEKTLTCPTCNGVKITSCPECKGSGNSDTDKTDPCSDCGSTGEVSVPCYECRGEKTLTQDGQEVTCGNCQGIGTLSNPCWICEGNGHLVTYDKCSTCRGKTHVKDEACKGTGKISCDTCNGKGKVTCSACDGTLIAACYICDGIGWTTKEFSSGVTVDFVEFTTTNDNTFKIDDSFPKSSDFASYSFIVNGPDTKRTYQLKERKQLPGEEPQLSPWSFPNAKSGQYYGAHWADGYSCSQNGTLVVEILIGETGEVVGRFEMPVK